MKIKTKVIFIVIIVFIFGLFIGFMLNRLFIQQRIKEAFSRVNPNRIPTFYGRVLKPNQGSSSEIRSILFKHAKKIRNIREDYQRQMEKANQSLYNELAPFLTPVQRERLNQRMLRPRIHSAWLNGYAEKFPVLKVIEKDVEFLKARLSLTEEQTVKVRNILRGHKIPLSFPERRPVRTKSKAYLDFQKRVKQRDQALKEVLNQNQKKLFERIRKQFN
jgi:hypothetical protein